MGGSWTDTEFFSADLGDVRLNKRLSAISEKFAQSPLSPINQACGNWAETKAAYRFFSNDAIAYEEIRKSHTAASRQRCEEYSTVLAVQDTTYLNYSQHPHTAGLCPLSRKKGLHTKEMVTLGLVMHSTFAVGTDGLPVGVVDQKIYSRPQLSPEMSTKNKSTLNNQLPVEDKDSYRWIQSLENTVSNLAGTQSRVVTVCDREADMYDFFLCADELAASVLVRANYNRTVNKRKRYSEKTGEKLWDLLKRSRCEATIQVHIPKQTKQAARTATCQVRFTDFVMNVPLNHCKGNRKAKSALNLYAVYVSEVDPPPDCERIDWMLLTNIPVKDRAQALEKVAWYCLRWRIETWHKVLKSGLQVEECRLSTAQRLTRYLAVMSIVAWRILWITLIARVAPETPCQILLSEFEWKVLAAKFNKAATVNQQPPSLQQSVTWIAQLGGFLARKSDGQPGITHIWRGMKTFANMLEGAELAKSCG